VPENCRWLEGTCCRRLPARAQAYTSENRYEKREQCAALRNEGLPPQAQGFCQSLIRAFRIVCRTIIAHKYCQTCKNVEIMTVNTLEMRAHFVFL
jgi:hypothetical protein